MQQLLHLFSQVKMHNDEEELFLLLKFLFQVCALRYKNQPSVFSLKRLQTRNNPQKNLNLRPYIKVINIL